MSMARDALHTTSGELGVVLLRDGADYALAAARHPPSRWTAFAKMTAIRAEDGDKERRKILPPRFYGPNHLVRVASS